MERLRKTVATALIALPLLLAAAPASADDYEPQWAGHPLRIVAYALHPVGVALDVLIFRPAHWVVTESPTLSRIFGHEKYTD
jgi:hypothetical protein